MKNELEIKWENLLEILKSYQRIAVAFSGGVDSTFLLYAAKAALNENVIAVTATPSWVAQSEQNDAKNFCQEIQVSQKLCTISADEIVGFRENPKNRCYLCKYQLFSMIKKIASENQCIEVVEGSNVDDEGDYRPGLQALAELAIKSPLREAKLTKSEIRELSKEFGLSTWDKPSFACLASRFPYGENITEDKLKMVEAAEDFLRNHGFKQYRVRNHGMMARIELPREDFSKVLTDENYLLINNALKDLGFTYVSLDLGGYQMGSLNIDIENGN